MPILSTGPIENNLVNGVRPSQQVTIKIDNRNSANFSIVSILGFSLNASRTLYVQEVFSVAPNQVITEDYLANFNGFEFIFTIEESMEDQTQISVWGKRSDGELVTAHRLVPSELLETPLESAIDMPFSDGFESYPLGDVRVNNTPWAGDANGFGFVENIDALSIRPSTPSAIFGNQLLRFDNPYAPFSPPSQTINQVSRLFNSTDIGTDFPTPITLSFNIRTIQTESLTPGDHAEVDIGLPRAGRFLLTTDTGGTLHAALLPDDFTLPFFVSDPLVFGQWYRISYQLDVLNNRYNYIEIDGVRYDNAGQGWQASVGRFAGEIQHVLIIQGSEHADQQGVYIDNISIEALIRP
ncbi:hypothetical protein ACERII_06625 [Evansella sp. AB-rgal1]|uniref:hypothetical protein n=1 Tax=Evansella sp. AB-rgal1 TaxID=3242696 RepID=UPI00359D49C9